MRKRLTGFTTLSAVVILAAALMFGGCSSDSPMAPEEISEFSKLIRSDPIMAVAFDAGLVKADEGGIIPIDRGSYSHKFVVQSEAMNQDKTITVNSGQQVINGKTMLVFEFGPSGLVFSKASALDIEISEINARAETAKLYYYDPDEKGWVVQDIAAVKNGRVVFDIYHFSKYAISD